MLYLFGQGRWAGLIGQILRRLGQSLVVLTGASMGTFFLINVLPGDVTASILNEDATAEQAEAIRERLGLDDSVIVRYLRWVGSVLKGDLGESVLSGQPVTRLLADRIPVTVQISLMAVALAIVSAVIAALIAARFEQRWPDNLLSGAAYAAVSAPTFVTGIVLVYILSVRLHWLPATGWSEIQQGLGANMSTAIMPAIALAWLEYAIFMRVLRSNLVSELHEEEYPTVARAKGLGASKVLIGHVFRNAALPFANIVSVRFGILLSGAVIIEPLFAVPGIGQLLVEAIYARDTIVVQGVILFIAAVFVILNMLADFLSVALDPRIRRG